MQSWVSSLFEKVDTKDEQSIIIKFLTKFEEIFQFKIIVPHISEVITDMIIDKYLSYNKDILFIFQEETYLIYKKVNIFTDNPLDKNLNYFPP